MGAALTASVTGPEMARSPPGASWEREKGKHFGYRGQPRLSLKVKKSDDGGKKKEGKFARWDMGLKSPKMILKVNLFGN